MESLFGPIDEPGPKGISWTRYAQVAPEQSLEAYPDGLTYGIPDSLLDIKPGDRVTVPLGRGKNQVKGYVLEIRDEADYPDHKIKAVIDREPVNFPIDLINLARWISQYYLCPLGMVFATMIPAAVKHGIGRKSVRLVTLPDQIESGRVNEIVKKHKLPAKQKAVLEMAFQMASAGRLPINPRDLANMADSRTQLPIKGLVDKGLLAYCAEEQVSAKWNEREIIRTDALTLNDEQQHAKDKVLSVLDQGHHTFLLHGVTGSGKTEVYLQIIEPIVAAGKSAIVLVPEIALTPQTVSRFLARFDHVAMLHSGLTDAQRHEQWRRIREGEAQVVVGARSAIFAPMLNLGVIIVDEEHDTSYKQDQAPRYNGRDVAVMRAHLLNIPVVLGSATPSLETHHNASIGRYTRLSLTKRATQAPMPKVEIIDMNAQRKQAEEIGIGGVPLISLPLHHAIQQTLDEKMQVMLLINRRGYSGYVACPDSNCGWMMRCNHCDTNLVYHRKNEIPTGGFLRCHYCGFENRMPKQCPSCAKRLIQLNPGSQKAEETLKKLYPQARVLRMDSDAMRTGAHYESALQQFRDGKIDILLGTQMIAKGLDFPKVRLVGVLSADTALHIPDFRSAERGFQLISQVSGRSGRAGTAGKVLIQTYQPDHPSIQFAAQHDYDGFAQLEIKHRELFHFPPYHRMASIMCRDKKMEDAVKMAGEIAQGLKQAAETRQIKARVYGPVEPGINRIRDYYRMRVDVFAPDARQLQLVLNHARQQGFLVSDRLRAVDVDPVVVI